MEVAEVHKAKLKKFKENVRRVYEYFKPNYDRHDYYMRFVFDSSIDDTDRAVLASVQKPVIECNIQEAYLSRQYGEFSKHEPSLMVSARAGAKPDAGLDKVLEDHMRHIFDDARRNGMQPLTFKEATGGGFSGIEIYTEYEHENSFDQVPRLRKIFNPTLMGFDQYAQEPHKGDSEFYFKLYPMRKEEFKDEFPEVNIDKIKFSRDIAGFSWSYSNNREDILLICEYYEVKKKKKKLYKLADGRTMLKEKYDKFIQEWEEAGFLEQPPIVIQERMTFVKSINRYHFIENEMLRYEPTDFEDPNIVFVDGNSIMLRRAKGQQYQQMTRPYVYHMQGTQKLLNFAIQTWGNELENMVQHKFKVAKESLPDEKAYLDPYSNIQQASVLVYKHFSDADPNKPLPPPQEVMRSPMPPEVSGAVQMCLSMTQSILGSYDASLGINDNQLSGVAIVEAATQSNAAAMPFVVSYMQSLSQVGNVLLKLFPKYYATPRSIPVMSKEGKRGYVEINNPNGGIHFDYDPNMFEVKVEPGVNFQIQKNRALQAEIALMQVSPTFNRFINEDCLEQMVDNLEVYGADILKEKAPAFMQKLEQEKQQQMKMAQEAQQNNPLMLKAQNERMKIEQEGQQHKVEMQLKAIELQIANLAKENERLKVASQAHNANVQSEATMVKAHAEEVRAQADMALKAMDIGHRHAKEAHEIKLKMTPPAKAEKKEVKKARGRPKKEKK